MVVPGFTTLNHNPYSPYYRTMGLAQSHDTRLARGIHSFVILGLQPASSSMQPTRPLLSGIIPSSTTWIQLIRAPQVDLDFLFPLRSLYYSIKRPSTVQPPLLIRASATPQVFPTAAASHCGRCQV
jgi:hypothetical protein